MFFILMRMTATYFGGLNVSHFLSRKAYICLLYAKIEKFYNNTP